MPLVVPETSQAELLMVKTLAHVEFWRLRVATAIAHMPVSLIAIMVVVWLVTQLLILYGLLHVIAPRPRLPFPSEKTYLTTRAEKDGPATITRQLPCWYDRWLAERRRLEQTRGFDIAETGVIEPADVVMSVVIPAYNEEARITEMLKEAVAWLDDAFGRVETNYGSGDNDEATVANSVPTITVSAPGSPTRRSNGSSIGAAATLNLVDLPPRPRNCASGRRSPVAPHRHARMLNAPSARAVGYEIVIVSDGSHDRTVETALDFARAHGLHDILRVVTLERNRGKGGAVAHGLRHVRGEYVVFADADGASRFADLGKLMEGLEEVVDGSHRGVAIGSRAHLVESEAVVKRSQLRNFLMRAFHLVLMILTPPATSRLRDTQCGFKLFTRATLPHIVPYMHTEGWIFDIEMLMLAESAPDAPILAADGSVIGRSPGIKVVEVPIAWHEVGGSKMSLVRDSIAMAWGLAVLRASWMFGVYRKRMT